MGTAAIHKGISLLAETVFCSVLVKVNIKTYLICRTVVLSNLFVFSNSIETLNFLNR